MEPLEVGDSRGDTLVVSSGISSDVSSGISSGDVAGSRRFLSRRRAVLVPGGGR
jgi:hypothetical protein